MELRQNSSRTITMNRVRVQNSGASGMIFDLWSLRDQIGSKKWWELSDSETINGNQKSFFQRSIKVKNGDMIIEIRRNRLGKMSDCSQRLCMMIRMSNSSGLSFTMTCERVHEPMKRRLLYSNSDDTIVMNDTRTVQRERVKGHKSNHRPPLSHYWSVGHAFGDESANGQFVFKW